MLNLEDIFKNIKEPQLEAIHVIEEYLKSDDIKNQALIKMPTGTGKTGIIAIVSHFYEDYKNVLIIAPNNILPRQIDDEIRVKFWKNIRINPRHLNLKRVKLYKVKDFIVPKKNEGVIIITTIQSLETLYKKEDIRYRQLKEKIDLIVFDEGHREPSIEWSRAIRQLGKKTILFTATPYRNDEALFSFHKNKYRYSLTFKSAVEQNLIKSVSIKGIDTGFFSSTEEFSKFVYQVYKAKTDRKLIIRCKNSIEVRDLTNEINNLHKCDNELKESNIAVGCHSNLGVNKSSCLFESGEELYTVADNFSIFIHENMLIEGLNIPEVDILFMYSNFENTRSLIQQIGRIVRRSKNKGKALVFVSKSEKEWYDTQWSMFLKYEEELNSKTSNPSISYFGKEFKENFVLDKEFMGELLVPKSSIIYEYDTLKFNDLIYHIKENLLNKSTISSYFQDGKDDLWVMCYEKVSYSNLLKSKFYKEITLECVILRSIEKGNRKFLFYYDSRGYSMPYLELNEFLKPIGTDKFLSLFPNSNTNFNQIKVNSLGVSNIGIYGRIIEGSNLQDIHTNINERLSFCRYAKGVVVDQDGKKLDRYIGALNSRVIDYERGSLVDYYKWTEKIVNGLINNDIHGYFNRFALPINIAHNIEASSILIDFTGISEELIVFRRENNQQVTGIESICIECVNNSFSFDFYGDSIDGYIERSGHGKQVRLRLNIPKFKSDYMILEGDNIISLEYYLNKEQAYRVFFNKDGIIYSDAYFFKPKIKFNNQDLDTLELGKQIFVIDGLDKCVEEKFGIMPIQSMFKSTWPNTSVFGCFLDSLLNYKTPVSQFVDHLVCDDFGNEIADFIAIDETSKKIILAHCKHVDKKKSASAFQDICGQAVKNIGYLIRNNIDLVDVKTHIDWWNNSPWIREKVYKSGGRSNVVVKIQTDRILKGGLTGEQFWEKYKAIIKSPDSQIEVWLVTDGLSRDALSNELLKVEPEPQIGPLMWILHCTQEVIGQIGGVLKIFCKK